jgi:hypothetical protein
MSRSLPERFSRRRFIEAAAALSAQALLGWGKRGPENLRSPEQVLPPVAYLMAPVTGVPVYEAPNESARFTPRHEIYAGAIISGEILGGNADFVRVHPDNGNFLLFTQEDKKAEVYVRRADFREITNFEPLSIRPDTQNRDKQIVVLYNGYQPEAFLLEKDQIVAYFPVGLGGNYQSSSTFPGDYHISYLRVTRNMNTLHGVPFVAYFDETYGKAFHGAPWRDWPNITEGYFGSAGCTNLASYHERSPYNISWDGEIIGFDHFVFRWLRTVFPFDVYRQEMMRVDWSPRDWYSGEHTVRALVCKTIDGLDTRLTHPQGLASFADWDRVKAQYLALKQANTWLLPKRENGEITFTTAPRTS